MPQLDDNLQWKHFGAKLEYLESQQRNLKDYEREFVVQMRTRVDSRGYTDPLGLPRWNPTVKQVNWLNQLAADNGYRSQR